MRKYDDLISKMTLEEKASLMSGANFWNTKPIERLGIPSVMLTDGPHGLRKQGGKADHLGLNKSLPATCFPPAATLANSWDTAMLEDVGRSIGKEAAAEQVGVLLGPGLNIKRNPLGGRNFEYFSEDPHLSGKLAASMVRGIQSNGIAASPKHFAVNSQEHMRMTIDEVVDERALREIYLEGFRIVVEESDPKTLMSAYNRVIGEFANENMHLMRDILYGEWNFGGVVVTDWGGNNDRVNGLIAGNQLEMPSTGGVTDKEIMAAVKAGALSEDILNDSVDRMLNLAFSTQQALTNPVTVDWEAHHQKAVEAARKSTVLLKNDGGLLPLDKQKSVAIIGDFAENPRYQGAGSSLVNPTKVDNTLETLAESDLNVIGYAQGFKRFGGKNTALHNKAVELAKKADVVLLFLGLDEGSEAEGIDRKDMKLRDNQLALAYEITHFHDNVAVILTGGSAIEMPFAGDVKAIVHGYLGGQGGATAMRDILLGDVNPSGKLAESYPLKYEDVSSAPYYPGREATAEHRESIFVGYRYFDTAEVPVLFPFGHGLSYTAFDYSDLAFDDRSVSFTIKNTGALAGEEIAQLYIKPLASKVFRANKELKGFAKVHLEPGEEQRVQIDFGKHAFDYFNPFLDAWMTEGGTYELQIGSSIADIRLADFIAIEGDDAVPIFDEQQLPHYYGTDIQSVGEQEFYHLLGYTPQHPLWDRTKKLGYNDTIAQGQYKKGAGKLLYLLVLSTQKYFFLRRQPLKANNVMFAMNMPFRQLPRFAQGKISDKTMERFMKLINLW